MEQSEIDLLKAENDRLKRLCRFQAFTLGFYGTPYNYNDANIAYHPISGQAASGIKADGGNDARQCAGVALLLGFTHAEISSWPGPGIEIPYGDKVNELYLKYLPHLKEMPK